MIVIPGPASQELGYKIALMLSARLVTPIFKDFPDGETYIRIPTPFKEENVVIVQSTYPPQLKHLFQLLQMREAIRNVENVIAVVPYLCYGRQDKEFLEGEAVTSRIVSKLLEEYFNYVITVDVHSMQSLPKNGISVSAFDLLLEKARTIVENPIVVLPDKGARERFKSEVECVYFSKHRDRETGEIEMEGEIKIEGRNFVVVDDIISTGGTMAHAIQITAAKGGSVIATATHGLMIGDAALRMYSMGAKEIITTDSIPTVYSRVSLAKLLSSEIKKLLR